MLNARPVDMNRVITLPVPTPREAYAQSLVGFMIWLPAVILVQPGWSPALLAFGPLVLYPLLLEMLGETGLRRVSLLAFLPALASYAFEQSMFAGALALPWLVFTLMLAARMAYGLAFTSAPSRIVRFIVACYLIIGASWLVLARLGERPLQYEHAIVHATAVHFHYAGFVLPILALQWLAVAPSRHKRLVLGALLFGVPFIAAGITLSAFDIHWPELLAVIFFAGACVVFATAQMRQALDTPGEHGLLLVSSGSLIVAMALALTYGVRHYVPTEWLDIPLMLQTHGPIQVFGFALPGVIAWSRRGASCRVGGGT